MDLASTCKALFQVAQQLKEALHTAKACDSDLQQLYGELRHVSHTIWNAMDHAISADDEDLCAHVQGTLEALLEGWLECRDVVYKHIARPWALRIFHPLDLQGVLDNAHTCLEKCLQDMGQDSKSDTDKSEDMDPTTVHQLPQAVQCMQQAARKAIQHLQQLGDKPLDDNAAVTRVSAQASLLLQKLCSSNGKHQLQAARSLGLIGNPSRPPRKAIPLLVDLLHSHCGAMDPATVSNGHRKLSNSSGKLPISSTKLPNSSVTQDTTSITVASGKHGSDGNTIVTNDLISARNDPCSHHNAVNRDTHSLRIGDEFTKYVEITPSSSDNSFNTNNKSSNSNNKSRNTNTPALMRIAAPPSAIVTTHISAPRDEAITAPNNAHSTSHVPFNSTDAIDACTPAHDAPTIHRKPHLNGNAAGSSASSRSTSHSSEISAGSSSLRSNSKSSKSVTFSDHPSIINSSTIGPSTTATANIEFPSASTTRKATITTTSTPILPNNSNTSNPTTTSNTWTIATTIKPPSTTSTSPHDISTATSTTAANLSSIATKSSPPDVCSTAATRPFNNFSSSCFTGSDPISHISNTGNTGLNSSISHCNTGLNLMRSRSSSEHDAVVPHLNANNQNNTNYVTGSTATPENTHGTCHTAGNSETDKTALNSSNDKSTKNVGITNTGNTTWEHSNDYTTSKDKTISHDKTNSNFFDPCTIRKNDIAGSTSNTGNTGKFVYRRCDSVNSEAEKLCSEGVGVLAACALAKLAAARRSNARFIAKSSAVAPLIALLVNGSDKEQLNAAEALEHLADVKSNKVKSKIVQAGAIPPLVNVVEFGTYEAKAHAATALGYLAVRHAANQLAIKQAGAIPPLVNILRSSCDNRVKGCAAHALWHLAYGHAANARAIVAAGAMHLLENLARDRDDVARPFARLALHAVNVQWFGPAISRKSRRYCEDYMWG